MTLRASGLNPLPDLCVVGRSVPGELQDSRERQLSCQLGLIQMMWLISHFGVAAREPRPRSVSNKPRQASAQVSAHHFLHSPFL